MDNWFLDGKGTSSSGDVQENSQKNEEKSGKTVGKPSFSVEAPLRVALVERSAVLALTW